MTVRVSDYIANFLSERGVKHVFLVTGGGAMHLNDAFGRQGGLQYVACHHEQACAMAAESYARMSGRVAAVNVTTGPGGTNTLTGVYGAYVDSIPMFVVSGQVKWETLVRSTSLPLRQLGDQEIDIVRIMESVTKMAEVVSDPKRVRYQLEKAWHKATTGRPGPVWLDVPMNVQGAQIEPAELVGYSPSEDTDKPTTDVAAAAKRITDALLVAKRPVILAGGGVRISGAYDAFLKVIEKLGVPVVTAWNAHDLLWDDHPLYAGRPGTVGDRAGNFAVQNADFLLVLGSRLNIRQISYGWQNFAREATIAMVDIDAAELAKPTLDIDMPVHADLVDFFEALLHAKLPTPPAAHSEYLAWCHKRRARYPVVQEAQRNTKDCVNPYHFVERLFSALPENERVVTGDGTACVVTFQAATIKRGQRLFTNSGCASMGYDLPAAIGACIANDKKRLVCIAGDGSIQMNLQELQTIVSHKLPVKIFVMNNQGYHSIRQTQHNYFPDNIVGCGTESGLGFPDMAKIASAYGIPFVRVQTPTTLDKSIAQTLNEPLYAICEVMLDLNQQFSPKLASRKLPDGRMVSSPLEDLAPFLSREELRENMLIPLVEE